MLLINSLNKIFKLFWRSIFHTDLEEYKYCVFAFASVLSWQMG